MMINIFSKNGIRLAVLIVVLLILFGVVFFFITDSQLGEGFKYVGNRDDDIYIKKNDNIIVKPTIVDFDLSENYIVGLRMPASYLECDNGGAYKIRIENVREYFVLNKKNENIDIYKSRSEFESKLDLIKFDSHYSLSFDKFDEIWKVYSKYYEKIDFSNCVEQVIKNKQK